MTHADRMGHVHRGNGGGRARRDGAGADLRHGARRLRRFAEMARGGPLSDPGRHRHLVFLHRASHRAFRLSPAAVGAGAGAGRRLRHPHGLQAAAGGRLSAGRLHRGLSRGAGDEPARHRRLRRSGVRGDVPAGAVGRGAAAFPRDHGAGGGEPAAGDAGAGEPQERAAAGGGHRPLHRALHDL